MQFQVGIYHEKFQLEQIQNSRPAATPDIKIFLCHAIHSTFFMYCSKNLYHISTPLIAPMSSKLCKIRTETRSWRPKWSIIGHNFVNMRNNWKTGPDS